MGKIVVSENVSLDGVIEDPAGDEGFEHGGWVGLIKDSPQLNQLALDEALGAAVVPASFELLRTLMEHGLVDELRLKVFPVVLGAGRRLFGETGDKRPMRLVDTRTVVDGVAFLAYESVTSQ